MNAEGELMFESMETLEFMDCEEGYSVVLGNTNAIIAIDENEVCCSFILSKQCGSSSKMISALEEYAKGRSKKLVFSNLISPVLEGMLKRRGYDGLSRKPTTLVVGMKAY